MDGLLLDTEPLYRSVSKAAAKEFGVSFSDKLFEKLIGRDQADVNMQLEREFGEQFSLADFRKSWIAHWDIEASGMRIKKKVGVEAMLAELERMQIPFAIATSTHRERTKFLLGAAGLTQRFPIVVTGEDVQQGKPAPDIYLHAALKLEVPAGSCVALEDSDSGVLAATAANMRTIMVPDLKAPSDAAASAASDICRDLNEARLVLAGLFEGA